MECISSDINITLLSSDARFMKQLILPMPSVLLSKTVKIAIEVQMARARSVYLSMRTSGNGMLTNTVQ